MISIYSGAFIGPVMVLITFVAFFIGVLVSTVEKDLGAGMVHGIGIWIIMIIAMAFVLYCHWFWFTVWSCI